LYSNLKMFDSALQCFRKALRLLSTDKAARASILQNIGAISNEIGLFSEGLEYHMRASLLFGKLTLYYYSCENVVIYLFR